MPILLESADLGLLPDLGDDPGCELVLLYRIVQPEERPRVPRGQYAGRDSAL